MMNVIHVLYHGYVNRAEHILLKLELHQVIDVIVLTIADVGNINQNVLIRKISKQVDCSDVWPISTVAANIKT